MATENEDPRQPIIGAQTQLSSSFRWQPRRRTIPLRRRKPPTVRLGGKKKRRGFFVMKLLKKIKLKWLKLHYIRMLRKLKEYYSNLVKEMMDASASIEAFHQRLLVESTVGLPLGVSFNRYPSATGSDQPRMLFII